MPICTAVGQLVAKDAAVVFALPPDAIHESDQFRALFALEPVCRSGRNQRIGGFSGQFDSQPVCEITESAGRRHIFVADLDVRQRLHFQQCCRRSERAMFDKLPVDGDAQLQGKVDMR